MQTLDFPTQQTPFVGRTKELDTIGRLLKDTTCQLLTLVGPGGIGKTRLAVESAREHSNMYADGVYFVPLQAVGAPDLISMAIAEAIGFQPDATGEPKDQLLHYLQSKNLLLVLDNLEHLLEDMSLLSNILRLAPHVKILTTSREPLKLREEWVFVVGGLSFPTGESELEIESYSAVQLFLQNAQRVSSSFGLSQTDNLGIVRICQIVDGMPLALELAAVWVRTLSCLEIAQEIERGLDILESSTRNIPNRHRNMRAVLDHSWVLLSNREQDVFMKLSIFRGGFTRAAAETVAGATLQTLATLVDKCLLRRTPDGRYDLHELLRQYGDEQLSQSGSKDMTRDAHSAYYLEFLHQLEQDIKGRRQVAALNEVETDFENIRTAWYWALERKNYQALDHAAESWFHFCEMRRRFQEGGEFLWTAQEQLKAETDPNLKSIRGRILVRGLWMLLSSNNSPELVQQARVQTEEMLSLARQQGDKPQTGLCLWLLGALGHIHITNESAKSIPLLEACLALFTELNDRFYMARAADWLGAVYGVSGQREKFIALSEQSLKWRQAIGDKFGETASLMNLMGAASDNGQYELAKQYAQEMGRIYLEIGSVTWMIHQTSILAVLAFQLGDFAETRRCAEETLQLASKRGLVSDRKEPVVAMLGMLAALEEDYTYSWQLCEQALSQVRLASTFLDEALMVAACGLGNYPFVQENLPILLKLAFDSQDQRAMTADLPIAAILLVRQNQPERASEVLGLAFNHHASARVWMEQWPLLTRLRADLETKLGSETYAEAWERGKHSDLETVAGSLLQHFQPDKDQPSIPSANSQLVEPLTERELEILHKIADGLSNAEIAEQLVIEVSTVKKHINRLYDKIGAKTRTHALVRARELHLL